MYSITIYSDKGDLLEQSEQEDAPDIEALCRKHELRFWRNTQITKRFSMTTYWYRNGRIHVKHREE